jgi:hypothetical protein
MRGMRRTLGKALKLDVLDKNLVACSGKTLDGAVLFHRLYVPFGDLILFTNASLPNIFLSFSLSGFSKVFLHLRIEDSITEKRGD